MLSLTLQGSYLDDSDPGHLDYDLGLRDIGVYDCDPVCHRAHLDRNLDHL